MGRQNRWTRVMAEFAVIVLGVLVALAADRWRESLGEAALREQYVQNLLADVQADLEVYESARISGVSDHAAQVMRALESDPPQDSIIDFLYAVEALQWYNPPVVTRETFDDLVSTGNLTLLRPELRRLLGQYYDRVTYFERREQLLAELLTNGYRQVPPRVLGPEIHPELFDRIQKRREDGLDDVPRDWTVEPGTSAAAVQRLRAIPELEAWIAGRLYVDRQHAEIYGDRLARMSTGLLSILALVSDGTAEAADLEFSQEDLGN